MDPSSPFFESGEVVENAVGGRASLIPTAFHLLPPQALASVAAVLKVGAAKYGSENPWQLSIEDHLNHALRHTYIAINERRFYDPRSRVIRDRVVDELTSAACRLLFALEQAINGVEIND